MKQSRSKKCGSCKAFIKLKNENYSLCDYHDVKVNSGTKSCEAWEGSEIPKRER